MPESNKARRYTDAAQKWRDLIERRCAHFVELHASGRWKHYYTEPEFRLRLREVAQLVERWKGLAPRAEDRSTATQSRGSPAAAPNRTAA